MDTLKKAGAPRVRRNDPNAAGTTSVAPFFSIIMPSYGVERYIEAALDDIQAQAFSDWELIVVDDGSPDNAARLVRERMASDGRIRLVQHDANRGLSAARNTGLSHARGAYVWIPDPDDRYDRTLLARVHAVLTDTAADAVVFGCTEEYFDAKGNLTGSRSVMPPVSGVASGDALHRSVLDLEEATLYGYAWNKVYRRSELSDLAFETVPLIEDILFNIAFFQNASVCVFLDDAPYRYAKRLNANLTNKFVPEYYQVHRRRIEALFNQQRAWGLDNQEVRSRLGSLYGRFIMSALERNCDSRAHLDRAGRIAWCRSLFADPLFLTLIPGATSRGGKVLSLGLAVLKTRSVLACCALGRLIHLVRGSGSRMYAQLKMQR